jgi:hypothetical protein
MEPPGLPEASTSTPALAGPRLDTSHGGMSPPGVLATRLAQGIVAQLRHYCPRVKRDGTAGLVGCWIKMAAEGGPAQPASSAACLDRA